ncbi:hypothetical protein MVEG_02214 [Podila verticillata NRRL 6337]|nr:hypothetical protein MVEG_02214 [Podila verticillata NRRL 6337]
MAQGSFLNIGQHNCGPGYPPCSASEPCCNNGACHKTSMEACAISLGCTPHFSYSGSTKSQDSPPETFDQGCFPLPACRPFKDQFRPPKHTKTHNQPASLVPKHAFTGDPEQALFISEFDHIAPHAEIDPEQRALLLKTKRDTIKTRDGGGFGATVSSTRWSTFGTFSVKMKSGTTGPGIVMAMMLVNPERGEEISIELVGRDPRAVVTEFYRRPSNGHSYHSPHISGGGGDKDRAWGLSLSTPVAWGRRRLRDLLWTLKDVAETLESVVPFTRSTSSKAARATLSRLDDDPSVAEKMITEETLEQTHELHKSVIEHAFVYTIEWSKNKITWLVDGKKIRVLKGKDVPGGLPMGPLQLQLTIWDAGYSPETMGWAGAHTDYGKDNSREYVTVVDWIEVKCASAKEGSKTWPGPEALKRLEEVRHGVTELPKVSVQTEERSQISEFFVRMVNRLLMWDFVALALIAAGLRLTDPGMSSQPLVKKEKSL